jgi:phosphatidylglycerol:prolipoprotein diacylglycerol transferase
LFKFHGLELHSYGLLLAIAFLLGIQLFLRRGVRRGLPEEKLSTLSLLLLVLAIVGGRGLYVLTHWSDYTHDFLGVFRIWEGGLMLYGGYFLAIAGGILYLRRARIPVWRVGDAAAPSMALGIGLGRIGCFLNGCCFGLPSHLPWAIKFPPGSYSNFVFPSEPLHPSQLYLAAAGIGQFALLLALDKKPRFDGRLFWTYIAIDATFRFLIDFTRYYDATSYLGKIGPLAFNVNQVFSVFLVAASVFMLLRLKRTGAEAAAFSPMPESHPSGPAPSLEAAETAPAHRDPSA